MIRWLIGSGAMASLVCSVGLCAQSGAGADARLGGLPPCAPDSVLDAPACLVRRVDAVYTDKARQAHIQGDVLLQAMVGPDGVIQQILVEKSLDTRFGLDQRAIAAVRQWEYRPARRDGQPTQQIVSITVPFELPDAAGLAPAPVAGETFPTVQLSQAGVVWPKLKQSVPPTYTVAGLRAKITGTVRLEAVVLPDGTVGAVRVLQSLDRESGLDDQAVGAAREWQFEPGTLDGRPVATRIQIALAFRLH